MEVWLKDLLKLQNIDLKLVDLYKKVSSIPLVESSLENDVVEIDKRLFDAKAALNALEVQLKKTELDATAQEQLAFKLKAQSPMVKKKDEYQAMLIEMKNAEEKANELEDKGLELLIEIEEMTETNAQLKISSKLEREVVGTKKEKLSVKVVEFDRDIIKGEKDRIAFAARLDEKVLNSYERVRKSKKGLSLSCAPLQENGTCSSCHLKNPIEIKLDIMKGQIVPCLNCSSILYIED